MKTRDGVAKHLLRESGKGLLPDEVLWRRKSPYPKTYDRAYEALLVGRVREILEDNTSPVLQFLDKAKTEKFLKALRLWKAMVWSADGGAADAGLYDTGGLLVEEV